MLLRTKIWPRTITDIGSTAFLTFAIPLIFYFEIGTVVPACVGGADTVAFYVHTAIGTFIVVNIITNQLCLILVDPSIRRRHLNAPATTTTTTTAKASSSSNDGASINSNAWHFCAVCETVVPPRSWHCATCDICVLKRDHHCAFSGCCVGHHNQRYFFYLIAYLCVGCLYASVFNSLFIFGVHAERFWQPLTAVKIMFPFAVVLLEPSWDQMWLTAYLVCMLGALFSGFLCLYHGQNLWQGVLVYERSDPKPLYDLGLRRNVEMVLGKRWWLTWISPFVYSELPEDGIHCWERLATNAKGASKRS